jgi:hypothetical protein
VMSPVQLEPGAEGIESGMKLSSDRYHLIANGLVIANWTCDSQWS